MHGGAYGERIHIMLKPSHLQVRHIGQIDTSDLILKESGYEFDNACFTAIKNILASFEKMSEVDLEVDLDNNRTILTKKPELMIVHSLLQRHKYGDLRQEKITYFEAFKSWSYLCNIYGREDTNFETLTLDYLLQSVYTTMLLLTQADADDGNLRPKQELNQKLCKMYNSNIERFVQKL